MTLLRSRPERGNEQWQHQPVCVSGVGDFKYQQRAPQVNQNALGPPSEVLEQLHQQYSTDEFGEHERGFEPYQAVPDDTPDERVGNLCAGRVNGDGVLAVEVLPDRSIALSQGSNFWRLR